MAYQAQQWGAAEALIDVMDKFGLGTQRRQMEFNSAEAEIQRNWEEQMANTAHQREVQDLQAAGLNPALSASLGGSATPAAASASTSGANSGAGLNFASSMIHMINDNMNTAKKLQSNNKLNDNMIGLTKAVNNLIKFIK